MNLLAKCIKLGLLDYHTFFYSSVKKKGTVNDLLTQLYEILYFFHIIPTKTTSLATESTCAYFMYVDCVRCPPSITRIRAKKRFQAA